MKLRSKKSLSILLSLALLLGMLPGMRQTAYADAMSTVWSGACTAQDTEITGPVTLAGDTTLNFPNWERLTVNGGINTNGYTLTVTGEGKLIVNGTAGTNGTDGGDGTDGGVGFTGTLIVNGADVNVTVTGGDGGAGGGISSSTGKGGNGGAGGIGILGNVTFSGDELTVNGGDGGAGGHSDNSSAYGGNGGDGGNGIVGNLSVDSSVDIEDVTVKGGDGGNYGGSGISVSDKGGNYGKGGNGVVGYIEGNIYSGLSGGESKDGNTYNYGAPYIHVSVTGVSFTSETAQTAVGDTVELTASVDPNINRGKFVTWSVSGTNSDAVELYSDADCTKPVGTDATEVLTVYAKGIKVGSAAITAASFFDDSKSASCNVTVALTDGQKPTGKTNLTYTGQAQALVDAPTSVPTGYTVQYSTDGGSNWSTEIPTGTNADNYTVKVKYSINDIDFAGDDVSVTISPAEVTVAALNQSIVVGDTAPDLSTPVLDTHYTVTGLMGDDMLTTAPTLAYSETPDTTQAGTYTITPSGASAGDNYTISYTPGTLTVAVVPVTFLSLTANFDTDHHETKVGETKYYVASIGPQNATDKTVKWTSTNGVVLYFDEGCTNPVGEAATSAMTVYAKFVKAGSVTVTVTANADSSKSLSRQDTISKGDVGTPTVTMGNYTYGTTVPTPGISEYPSGVTPTYYYNTTNTNTDGTAWTGITSTTLNVGTYYMYAVFDETDNYNAYTTSPDTFIISKAGAQTIADVTDTLVYTATSVSESVAGVMPTNAGTLTYTVGTESKTGSVTVSDFAVNASGTVTATLSGGAAGDTVTLPVTIHSTNYADSTVNVVITLTDKADAGVSITGVPDSAKTYGDDDFTLTASVTNEGSGTGTWTWTSGDDSVFQITSNGGATATVTILKAGSAAISAQYESDTTIDTETTASITVNQKAVTITAMDQSIYVGDTVPTLSGAEFYTVDGLVGSDTLTTAPTLAYSSTPVNTQAGTYTIIPSGAAASANYDISYTNGTLTISDKGTQTITANDLTVTYGDTDKSVSARVTEPATDGGAISYAVKSGSENYIEVAADGKLTIKEVPADGKAYVTVTAAETATYAQATKDVTVTINAASSVVTKRPVAKSLTYSGAAQELVTAGEATGGTMQYALGQNATTAPTTGWDTSIPTAANVGTYYVWYKVVADKNYADTTATCLTATISRVSGGGSGSDDSDSGSSSGSTTGTTTTTTAGSTTGAANADASTAATTGTTAYTTPDGAAVTTDRQASSETKQNADGSVTVTDTAKESVKTENEDGSKVETKTETVKAETTDSKKNADGSVTDTTKVNNTETVTETATNADGKQEVTETRTEQSGSTAVTTKDNADGTKTETTATTETVKVTEKVTDANGKVTETVTETSTESKVDMTVAADGTATGTSTTTTTVKDEKGNVLSTAVTEAEITAKTDENGTTVTETAATTTTKDANGVETVEKTVTTGCEAANGSTGSVVKSEDGTVLSQETTISQQELAAALKEGRPVQAPLTVEPAPKGQANALTPVQINLPSGQYDKDGDGKTSVAELPRVEIQITVSGPGVIAMLRDALGRLNPIKECFEGSVIVPVTGSGEIFIVDNTKTFADVPEYEWYNEYIAFVTAREIFNGMDDGSFSPDAPMTRAMLMQALYNYHRGAVAGDATRFSDVLADDWFNAAIGWALENKIVNGYDNGSFGANDGITRQDMATILYRYAKWAGYDVSASAGLDRFPDAGSVEGYAIDAMRWAVGAGLISGMDDGTLSPTASATRAQVATMLTRFVRSAK